MLPSLSIVFCPVLHCFLDFTQNLGQYPVKYQKSVLLRTLETLCGILFVIAMALLILDIYLKGIR